MSVTTGKVRLSYCHVWQPQAPQSEGEPKYSVTILIPKTDVNTIKAIHAEMEAAKQAGVSSTWGGVMPPIVRTPLYDGDGVRPSSGEPFGDECKGHMVITASSKIQPGVVDINVQPILNQAEVYSGCYGRVCINFFVYSQAGNKGVGCGLQCVQKIADGEPLSGGVSVQEAFGGSNTYQNISSGTPYQPAPAYQVPSMPAYQMPQNTAPIGQQPLPYGYQAPVPSAPSVNMYQQPISQTIDPITGQPLIGGIMGM